MHLANGKRLDSYVPGEEIVSRKATDFDNIQESTFRDYVREIGNKYDEGTVIRSNKYPDLDGQPLEGRRILEVPDSNLSAARREEFERIARAGGRRDPLRPGEPLRAPETDSGPPAAPRSRLHPCPTPTTNG